MKVKVETCPPSAADTASRARSEVQGISVQVL
jgi:hypothetical protein